MKLQKVMEKLKSFEVRSGCYIFNISFNIRHHWQDESDIVLSLEIKTGGIKQPLTTIEYKFYRIYNKTEEINMARFNESLAKCTKDITDNKDKLIKELEKSLIKTEVILDNFKEGLK